MSHRFHYGAGAESPMPVSETRKKRPGMHKLGVTFVTILLIMALALQLSGCQAGRPEEPGETKEAPEVETADTAEDVEWSEEAEYPEAAPSEEAPATKSLDAAPPPAPSESGPGLSGAATKISSAPPFTCNYYMYVTGVDYYLALRTAKSYDAANEIGKLRNGERVQVMNDTTGQYWYVYASTLGKYGYVNSDYLTSGGTQTGYYMYVTGVDYYLALRTAKSYDAANEIGKIRNGEAVEVLDDTTGTYWYVYAPTLGKKGYVNSNYLTSGGMKTPSRPTSASYYMYVTGVDYYLALRTAKSYDAANEIGKIRNGEAVEVLDDTTGTYWYVYAPTLGKKGYVNSNYLTSGGTKTPSLPTSASYYMYVTGVDYYLALRTAKSYDASNEIGKIRNGEAVEVLDDTTGTYWYVYAPTLGKKGYVNSTYLTAVPGTSKTVSTPQNDTYTVYGVDYYLALRTAPEYNGNNEIGKIYNGQTVELISKYGTYWYVYAPTLGSYGYVNSNYLR